MKITHILTALSLALCGVHGFWRMECRGRVGLGRIDPLVSPGEASQHAHAIHGSSAFSMTSTYEDLLNADCTSCAVKQDKSAYWAPAMYFQHVDGTFELVPQVGGMLAYYFLNAAPGQTGNITAFPANFRMIAGDTQRRTFSIAGLDFKLPDPEKSLWSILGQTTQADLAQRALGFNCLNYARTPEGSLYRHYMPTKDYLDQNCADGVRLELMFPSCWDGKNLDSANHKTHVAYPDLVMNGNCPSDFPVRLPGLFYETIWDTNHFNGVPGQFVMSNGDVNGFAYHGDFMMGWEQNFLQDAVDTCTSGSGRIQDCSLFTIQDEYTQNQCSMKVPGPIAAEKVFGNIGAALPGNVPVAGAPGQGQATGGYTPPPAATAALPTVGYAPGNSASVSGSYLPGDIFIAKPTTTAVPDPTPAPAPSSDPAPAPTAAPSPAEIDDGLAKVKTEYITNGNVVQEIIWEEVVTTVTEAEDTTITVTVSATPTVQKARRHAHLHQHLGRHGRPRHH